MSKDLAQIILTVERAASDLRRKNIVKLIMQNKQILLIKSGEYFAVGEKLDPFDHPAVKLMKIAGLLPIAVIAEAAEGDFLSVEEAAINQYPQDLAACLEKVSEAKVPLKNAESARIIAFRPKFGHDEHLAIIIGDPASEPAPWVRVHSSCVTGDVLASLRCDCGNQLQKAIAMMSEKGAGVLLYLSQEGRGIGIANKLRAYCLQDGGLDTLQANEALGFAGDERDFAVAAKMLKQLGIAKISLLTNNPLKITALGDLGIQIVERIPLISEKNIHNENYLLTKAEKMGHQF